MGLIRFGKGARFVWDAFLYVVEERLVDNTFRLKNLNIGGYKIATRTELASAWAGGKLVFETFGRTAVKHADQLIATSYTVADFKGLPEHLQYITWRRYQYVLPFVGLPPHRRNRKAITAYIERNKDIIEARARAFKEGFKHPMPALPPVPNTPRPSRARRNVASIEGTGGGGERGEGGCSSERQLGQYTAQPNMHESAIKSPLAEAAAAPTVERWLTNFALGGYSLRGLTAKNKIGRAKQKSSLDEQVEEIISEVLDEYRGKEGQHRTKLGVSSGYNTIESISATVEERVAEKNRDRMVRNKSELVPPSYDIVRDRIYQSGYAEEILKRPPAGRLEAHAGAMIQAGVEVTRIMERVELDDTWIDLIVVDEVRRLPLGRPNITAASDVHSGMPGGFYLGFEGSSSNAARQCLLHLILPKPDTRELYHTKYIWDVGGKPEMVVTDGGPGFNSSDMYTSCGEAGIVFEILPVQTAWWKPHIERFFRTVSQGLLKPLPGSTFSNILERGGYDPEKYACISLTAFLELLHTFFVDYLPSKWHEGRECYPRDRWAEQALQYEPVLHHSADDLRRIFSRTAVRIIHDYGVEWETIRFNSLALQALAARLPPGAKVRLKIDDYDLSKVNVIDETNPEAHVAIAVPAVNQAYTKDLSVWGHRTIRKFVNSQKAQGAEASMLDLIQAKEHIQQVLEREFLLTKSTKRRQKSMRFLDETGYGRQPGGLPVTSSSVTAARSQAQAPDESAPLALPAPADVVALPSASPESTVGEPLPVEIVQLPPQVAPASVPSTRPAGDYSLPGMNSRPRRGRGAENKSS